MADQLRDGPPTDRLAGWITTVVITVGAFVLRWWNLGQPAAIMFDESAYAKDAWSLYRYGYEGSWTAGDNQGIDLAIVHGDASALTPTGGFASHPEVGKWLIGAGEAVFGLNPFGWRVAALVFGALLVFMVIRLGRRLGRSTLVGALAGLFIAVDGLSFTMSRIAMLDIFEVFFIVAGAAAVVTDRDYFRRKLADALDRTSAASFAGRPGPFVFRPWLIVAGLMFGLACATKWNAVYPLAVFAVLTVVWSVTARRLAGAGNSSWWGLLTDGLPAFVSMVVVALGVYLASWAGWLATSGGYDRQWGATHPDDPAVSHLGTALGSLWHYTTDMYAWATGPDMASINHPYASNPWDWPLVLRTIGLYAQPGIPAGQQGRVASASDGCLRVITGLGTPILWWGATAATLVSLAWWIIQRNWRYSVVALATCSTWLPWMVTGRGSVFSYYALTMIPFMAIGLAMVLGTLARGRPGRFRLVRPILVGVYVALVVADFAFNYPIYTAQLLTTAQYDWRMWLPGWT